MSPAMPATYSNTPPTPDRLISVAAAASMAKCSPATIRRRIDSGDLRSWSMGPRLTRVDSAEVMARLCGDDH